MLSGLTKSASFSVLVVYVSTTSFEAIAFALFFTALHASTASRVHPRVACSVGDYLSQAKHVF